MKPDPNAISNPPYQEGIQGGSTDIIRQDLIDRGIPPDLAARPYDRDAAFAEIDIHMNAARDHLTRAGHCFAWIQFFEENDKFFKICEKRGYDPNAIAIAMVTASRQTSLVIGEKTGRAKPKKRSLKCFFPDSDQLGLFTKEISGLTRDAPTYIEMSERLRQSHKEKGRLKQQAADERARRDHAERELLQAHKLLESLKNWQPANADQQKLSRKIKGVLSRATIIRASLEGVRLSPPIDSLMAGALADAAESIEKEIRVGTAWLRLQLGLESPDELSLYKEDAETSAVIAQEKLNILNNNVGAHGSAPEKPDGNVGAHGSAPEKPDGNVGAHGSAPKKSHARSGKIVPFDPTDGAA